MIFRGYFNLINGFFHNSLTPLHHRNLVAKPNTSIMLFFVAIELYDRGKYFYTPDAYLSRQELKLLTVKIFLNKINFSII